jgi:hypothetical protein
MNIIKIILIILISLIIIASITTISIVFSRKHNKNNKIKYFKCYEKPNGIIVKDIFNKEKIERNSNEYNLYLPCGYNNVETEMNTINNHHKLKYVFGVKGCDTIVSKNFIWDTLEKYYGRENATKIMPETYVLSNKKHLRMLVDKFYQIPNIVMICKKNIQRKKGLLLINNINDIDQALKDNYKIAQIYQNNLLLIMDRKVNLRIYLLIIIENNIFKSFINKEGKCLYTNKKYNGNTLDFESNVTSYNVDQELYNKYPHTLTNLATFLIKDGYNWKDIWNKIVKIFQKTMEACYTNFKQPQNLGEIICFQLFGADIILDKNGNPYLLEINKGPDMIPKFDKDYVLKRHIYNETFNKIGITKSKNNNYIPIFEKNLN